MSVTLISRSTRVRAAFLIVAGAFLAACSSTDSVPDLTATGTGGAATDTAATGGNPAFDFSRDGYCPPLQLRAGTGSTVVYERGQEGKRDHVRYQASITQKARECRISGNTLTMDIGISGRVVAGPKGSAGTVRLPVRVVIAKQVGGTKALYSNLFTVPVTLSAPQLNANYREVFRGVSVEVGPNDRNLIVYIGFDEGK